MVEQKQLKQKLDDTYRHIAGSAPFPEDLLGHEHRAERCIEALKDVLWPPGLVDEEWPAGTLAAVVNTLCAHGYVDEVLGVAREDAA